MYYGLYFKSLQYSLLPSSERSGDDSTAVSGGFGRSAGGATGAGGGNYGGSGGFTGGGSIWSEGT